MSTGMLKLFAGVTLALSAFTFLFFAILPNAATQQSSDDGAASEWSYAVIIDAGSTGSRLFVYKYRSVNENDLIVVKPVVDPATFQPVVKKVTPGLASFTEKPSDATNYIKPLLDYAAFYIPLAKQSFTSLFILATAGMRLLPKVAQDGILDNLHTNLPTVTKMQVISEHIRVIEGKWEGIYSWIALNYILGRFSRNESESRQATVGIIDMGGASVQIAVELNTTEEELNKTVENINLGCRDDDTFYQYHLYVTTFLGYGVNEGLRKYEQKLSDIVGDRENTTASSYVRDPCLPTNLVKQVLRKDGRPFARRGYGDWDACVDSLTAFLMEDVSNSDCYALKCFLGLVRSPTLSISNVELYGFSEYWFSLEDVLGLGGAYNFTKLSSKARDFCKLKWSTIQARFRQNMYPKADDERLRTQCFKSAWITSVLHSGFHIDKFSNRFQSVFMVNGQEAHWALGALLYYMRYVPLRETIQRTLSEKSYRKLASGGYPSFFVFTSVALSVLILFMLYRTTRKRILRRDPSMWGYMMLTQDQP